MNVSSSPFCPAHRLFTFPPYSLRRSHLCSHPNCSSRTGLLLSSTSLLGKHFSQLCKWLAPSQPRHLLRETSQSSGFWKTHSWVPGHPGWPVTLSTFVLRVLSTDNTSVPGSPTALGHGTVMSQHAFIWEVLSGGSQEGGGGRREGRCQTRRNPVAAQ